MAVNYGDSSETRPREVYQSNIKSVVITIPATDVLYGSPLYVTYMLDSDKGVTATQIQVSYTTNGSDWYSCTADSGDPLHEGLTNLSADADMETHVFVWDALTDLGVSYDGTDLQVRVRAYDGSAWSAWENSGQFDLRVVPAITISSPNTATSGLGTYIDVNYAISSPMDGETYSIECEYSTNEVDWYTCTAHGTDPDHDGISGLSESSYTFVWKAELDLGASYDSTAQVRIRAHNGSAWGSWTESTICTISMIPTADISAPVSGSTHGNPVYVYYTLNTNRDSVTLSIDMEYSIDSGSNYYAATADATDPLHDGVSGLSEGSLVFVWNSAADLTTAFQGTQVKVRTRVSDATNQSAYVATSDFEVDMLPAAPTLVSPASEYFDAWDEPEFVWIIPTDPGSDRITFRVEIDDDLGFGSASIDHNSVDNLDRFYHQIDTANAYKNGANGISYYVRDLDVTSTSGTAVNFADLTDYHTETAIPASLTNPQVLLINRADRRCYLPASGITSSGFTIYKSAVGVDSDGIVDLLIYAGSAGSFETYWVDVNISSNTAYTLGVAPFDTDELGNSIPGSITDLRPEVIEGSDRGVYFSSVTNSGFTVNLSAVGVSTNAQLRLCLRGDPSETYQHQALSVTGTSDLDVDFDNTLDDATNGGAAWPSYLPGTILSLGHVADRNVIISRPYNDQVGMKKSSVGVASNGSVDLHGFGEANASVPYYTDVSPNGVPDSFEGEQAKYKPLSTDTLGVGDYYWRVRGGNIS
jgi:hypothetical protein